MPALPAPLLSGLALPAFASGEDRPEKGLSADRVEEVDRSVGRVLDALRAHTPAGKSGGRAEDGGIGGPGPLERPRPLIDPDGAVRKGFEATK